MIKFVEPGKFEFYEVDFSKKDKNGRPKVDGPNPERCAACHEDEYHKGRLLPRWASYKRWNGFFGSFDDAIKGDDPVAFKTFITLETKEAKSLGYSGPDPKKMEEERQGFLKFQEWRKDHPRYKYLRPPLIEKNPYSPYAATQSNENFLDRHAFMPNSTFSGRLARLVALERLAMMKLDPNFQRLRDLYLIDHVFHCDDLKSDLTTKSDQKAIQELRKSMIALYQKKHPGEVWGPDKEPLLLSYYGIPTTQGGSIRSLNFYSGNGELRHFLLWRLLNDFKADVPVPLPELQAKVSYIAEDYDGYHAADPKNTEAYMALLMHQLKQTDALGVGITHPKRSRFSPPLPHMKGVEPDFYSSETRHVACLALSARARRYLDEDTHPVPEKSPPPDTRRFVPRHRTELNWQGHELGK